MLSLLVHCSFRNLWLLLVNHLGRGFVAVLLSLSGAFTQLSAATIYVNADQAGEAEQDGTSWERAYKYLNSALQAAEAGDEVWIARGRYYPLNAADGSNSVDPANTFTVPSAVALYGGFVGNESARDAANPDSNPTILDGGLDRAYHVVTAGDKVTLSGLIIRNGDAREAPLDRIPDNNSSGAIFLTNPDNALTLETMILENNRARDGAVSKGGHWTVKNSVFRGNDASNVGGVAMGGTWQVVGSLFLRNSANSAGVFFDGEWTVRDSVFRDNTALGPDRVLNWPDETANRGGGGVASGLFGYSLTAINTEFSGNFADLSGVAGSFSDAFDAYTVNCTNCLFENNAAFEGGVSRGGTWNIVQSVFIDNDAITKAGVAVGGKWTVELSTFAKNGVGFNEPRRGRTAVNGPSTPAQWTIRDSVFADEDFVPINPALDAAYRLDITYPDGAVSYNLLSKESFAANEGVLASLLAAAWNGGETPINGTFLFAESAGSPFADETDPVGPDGIWGTADDGLRLRENSPAADLGNAARLPLDVFDLDGDNDRSEVLPIDFSIIRALSSKQATSFIRPRALSFKSPYKYELGAYEGTALTLSVTTNLESASITPSGSIPWAQFYLREIAVTNNAPSEAMAFSAFTAADPDAGNFFGPLSDDGNGRYSRFYLPTASTTLTAEYAPDTKDDDGDGLTNYDEIVLYGSDPQNADSSGDGIADGTAVEAGLDPTQSYDAIVNDIQNKMVDLRAGSKRITPGDNGKLRIELQLERSRDLQSWTDGPNVIHEVTPDGPAEFYRFRLE